MKLVFAELMIWFAYLVITKFQEVSGQHDRERIAEGYDK